MIGGGREEEGFYYLTQSPIATSILYTYSLESSTSPRVLPYQCLADLSLNKLHCVILQLPPTTKLDCEACQLRQNHQSTFLSSDHPQSTSLFDLVHEDVCVPIWYLDRQGHRYYLIMVDSYSPLS